MCGENQTTGSTLKPVEDNAGRRVTYRVVTRAKDWGTTGFLVEEAMASLVTSGLNSLEEEGDWQVISVPLSEADALETLSEWSEQGL